MIPQILGTFSGPGGRFQVTTNGVSFVDEPPLGTTKELGDISLNRGQKVSQKLIDEAESIYGETGVIQCIFDLSDKIAINKHFYNKDIERDLKLDLLLDGKFYVDSWYELSEIPSRLTYYDTITKQTNLFERHKNILEYMNSIGFSISNLMMMYGLEGWGKSDQELLWDSYLREVPYSSTYVPGVIIRVKPNLMVEVIVVRGGANKKYFFFYNPKQILNIVIENCDIEYKRELKIKNILT